MYVCTYIYVYISLAIYLCLHACMHVCMYVCKVCLYVCMYVHTSGLKPDQVIWVNQVTFNLGQVGLTQFIKYPGLTWILRWITCINNRICFQP